MKPNTSIWKPFTIAGSGNQPVKIVSGKGLYLRTEDERSLMDLVSSWWVNLHGHAHPHIAKAIADQARSLEHVIFADFTHDPAEKLADRLIASSRNEFAKVFFSDNGSTAVEVALKIALQYWTNVGISGRNKIISFEGAYHGDTFGAMSASATSVFNKAFSDHMFETLRVGYAQTWIGDGDRTEKEDQILKQVRFMLEMESDKIAALIIEPLIQGAGGMRMCSTEFIANLVALVRSYGVLVIFDEVMTGFGRTGSMFAYQQCGIVPDIICLSKGITGGFMPFAVTMTTENIFNAFDVPLAEKTFWHGHSYTANPLGCAAALASLELLADATESYSSMDKIHESGWELIKNSGRAIHGRICGTILAFDVVTEDSEKGYLSSIGTEFKRRALEFDMLLRPLGNVVYLMPPYCITESELNEVYGKIGRILHELR